ncbi:MAG TPA: acetylornithine deacetylase [Thermomicrobiaceae bacterium]|nr:acetylornithine deacetylase [Thermomicrobiaceae bacterium]
MSTPTSTAIREAIAGSTDDLLALAGRLIAFPTESPPGRNTAAIQGFLADFLRGLGFDVERFDVYPGDPDLIATLRGTGSDRAASLLLNGHVDVAEVGLVDAWTHPPFAARVAGGRLYGRGADDMKGPLAAALHAVATLRRLGVALPGDLVVQTVIGEEQGEAGTLSCVERGSRADFAIVAEPTGLAIAGQGGVITGWIEIQSPETLHDGMRARTIHAGGGVRGASAVEKMVKVITALQELERHWAVVKRYPGMAPGSTTINPAVIEGGRHPAFIADRCALWVTVHYYPDETAEQVTAEIEDHVRRTAEADLWLRDHPPTFRWGGRSMIEDRGEVFPPSAPDPGHPGVRALARAHAAVLGREPELVIWPSVSDAGWLAGAGIPTVIYGPGGLEQAHTVDEWVAVDDLVHASQVYAEMIVAWCSSPKPRA